MTPEFAVEMLKSMILQAVTLMSPILLTAMAIGLSVSLFQAVTSINEQTLTFVPKAAAIISLILVLMPWMIRTMVEFTTSVIQKIPQMAQ